jgi:hypothetical protein
VAIQKACHCREGACQKLGVMRGLEPRIHDERHAEEPYVHLCLPKRLMDCRVKPGNDSKV